MTEPKVVHEWTETGQRVGVDEAGFRYVFGPEGRWELLPPYGKPAPISAQLAKKAARVEELEKAIRDKGCSCIWGTTDPDNRPYREEICWRCDTLEDLGIDPEREKL